MNCPIFRLIQQSFSRTRCWMKNWHNRLTFYTSQAKENHMLQVPIMSQLSRFERELPVLRGQLLSSWSFLKSPVLRWFWLECQIFMNFSSRSQFLQVRCQRDVKILAANNEIRRVCCSCRLILCTPLFRLVGEGKGGGEVEPPIKLSKRGGLTGPQLWEGVAGKEGGNFFQGVVAIFTRER